MVTRLKKIEPRKELDLPDLPPTGPTYCVHGCARLLKLLVKRRRMRGLAVSPPLRPDAADRHLPCAWSRFAIERQDLHSTASNEERESFPKWPLNR